MKIVIDIDEEIYNLRDYWSLGISLIVREAIRNGTPLPDNATNGDVIKALFLHKDIEIDEHKNYTQMYYTDSYITFPSSWWNAKYKAGDTE